MLLLGWGVESHPARYRGIYDRAEPSNTGQAISAPRTGACSSRWKTIRLMRLASVPIGSWSRRADRSPL